MNRIAFTLDIAPQSLQFSGKRLAIVGGKPRFFRAKKAETFRRSVALLTLAHRPRQPFDGPVRLELTFVLPRPLALLARRHADTRLLCAKRPDADNLAKGAVDVLTEAGFWHDDGQISQLVLEKSYTARGERPCIEVAVSQIEPAFLGLLL